MSDDDEFREYPTGRGLGRTSLEYRHGLMMKKIFELQGRVEYLEGQSKAASHSMRPQRVTNATITVVVAGIVAGVIQAISRALP